MKLKDFKYSILMLIIGIFIGYFILNNNSDKQNNTMPLQKMEIEVYQYKIKNIDNEINELEKIKDEGFEKGYIIKSQTIREINSKINKLYEKKDQIRFKIGLVKLNSISD